MSDHIARAAASRARPDARATRPDRNEATSCRISRNSSKRSTTVLSNANTRQGKMFVTRPEDELIVTLLMLGGSAAGACWAPIIWTRGAGRCGGWPVDGKIVAEVRGVSYSLP